MESSARSHPDSESSSSSDSGSQDAPRTFVFKGKERCLRCRSLRFETCGLPAIRSRSACDHCSLASRRCDLPPSSRAMLRRWHQLMPWSAPLIDGNLDNSSLASHSRGDCVEDIYDDSKGGVEACMAEKGLRDATEKLDRLCSQWRRVAAGVQHRSSKEENEKGRVEEAQALLRDSVRRLKAFALLNPEV